MHTLRQIFLVAQIDLANALRSRRAIAMLLLYILAVLGATYTYCQIVRTMISEIGPASGLAESLSRAPQFRQLVEGLVGDSGVAEKLLETPPLALFFGAISLFLLPLLSVVNSSDAVAGQVRTGESRFILFRSGRLPFVLGTFVGQALVMTLGLALGAVIALVVGTVMLGGSSLLATGFAMSWIGVGALFYSFAYLGLAVGVSQLVDSSAAARSLGFAIYIGLSISYALLNWSWLTDSLPESLVSALRHLFPQAYKLGLWRATLIERLPSMLALLFLGALYCLPGWLYFRRRDL